MALRSTLAVLALSASGLMPLPAHADMDADGNVVKAESVTAAVDIPMTADATAATEEAHSTEARTPLLVIRFNQRHVYFDHTLQQAVSGAERAKSNVIYSLVSYEPSATGERMHNEHAEQSNAANARSVIDAMRRMGIPKSRIKFSTQTLESGDSQEVRLYVK